MKYVLLFCGTADDQAAFDALSQDDLAQRYAQVGQWFAEHRGAITGGNQLAPRDTATTVRLSRRSEPLVMAKTWPGGGAVEIRPVMQSGGG
jgi:hypothetical protein